MWGLVNLLPIYPLDGGQIAQQVFVLTNPQDAIRQSLILSVIVGGMMAVIAFVQWQSFFLAVFFLWLTYSNFTDAPVLPRPSVLSGHFECLLAANRH